MPQRQFQHENQEPPVNRTAANRRTARRFLARCFLFFLPLFFLFGLLEALLWRSGESWSVEHVISMQRQHPDWLWERGLLSQDMHRYKYLNWQQKRPEILVIGSSRVMEFRAPMFGSNVSFYNAGGMTRNITDLEQFVAALTPQTTPRVLIIGVDMWWVGDNYPTRFEFDRDIHVDAVRDWRAHALVVRKLFPKLEEPKRLAREIKSVLRAPPPYIGWMSRVRKRGFRADGSRTVGLKAPDFSRFRYRPDPSIKQLIATGGYSFEFSNGINEKRFQALRRVLLQLKKRDILVLVFTPPLASPEAQIMDSLPRQQKFWREYQQRVPALVAALDLPYCDASTLDKVGLDDRYMRDCIHAMETFHLHVLRHWLRDSRVRAALPQAQPAVQYALTSPHTNLWYADYQSLPR